jgi:hypothetical protein
LLPFRVLLFPLARKYADLSAKLRRARV